MYIVYVYLLVCCRRLERLDTREKEAALAKLIMGTGTHLPNCLKPEMVRDSFGLLIIVEGR